MKVALLTWFYPPGGTGLGRAAQTIAHGLRDAGCSVKVITGSLAYGRRQWDAGIEIIGSAPPAYGRAAVLRRRACLGHLVGPWYFRKMIAQLHAESPFDIVESTNWFAPAAFLGHGALPVVIRNSTPAIDTWPTTHGVRNRIDLRFAHGLERRTAQNAAALISNTQTHHTMISQVYRVASQTPHHIVELALDPALLARGKKAPRPAPKKPVFLFVGRDERRKGFREMLGAFCALAAERRHQGLAPAHLMLVGIDRETLGGALQAAPEKAFLGKQITAFKDATEDALHDLYAASSIVLAPSRYESYGLVYREAAAFGRPLIACAEDPAAADFVARTEAGILAGRCTPEAIKDAMAALMSNPDLQWRLGQNGLQHAANLTRRTLGEETLSVYESVVQRSRPRAPRSFSDRAAR